MKRTGRLARSTEPIRRYTRLRQVGRKAKAEAAERDMMRNRVITITGGRCCAKHFVPEVTCWGVTEVHELIERSLRPGVHLDAAFGITLCTAHHRWVSDDWDRARRHGYTFRSSEPEQAMNRADFLRNTAAQRPAPSV